jgi:hypothetical protein
MPRTCTICGHPQRSAIDEALVDGAASLREIASLYAVSQSAVRRHKARHLPTALAQAQAAQEVAHGDNLLAQVRSLQARALAILERAEGAGELKTALLAIREARECLALLAKLLGQLDERAQVNILVASPEWLTLRARILVALEPYPEARLALAAALEVDDAGR